MHTLINITFLIILSYILFYLIRFDNPFETFLPGIFGTDALTKRQNSCTPENNCFLGSYARTQIFQNVCQPQQGLLRQKIPLGDNCQRTFGDVMATPKSFYVCELDKHLQRKCQWVKRS